MLKRIVCLMAAIALTVASAVPALAITPQEGWFISGTMEIDGINYYIIDNKVNDQKWWVDLSGGYLQMTEGFYQGFMDDSDEFQGIAEDVIGFYYTHENWLGFCPDNDFRIDNDWLIEISLNNFEGERALSKSRTEEMTEFCVYAYDRSKMPYVTLDYSTINGYYYESSKAFSINQTLSNSIPFSGTTRLGGALFYSDQIGSTRYVPVSNFGMDGLFSSVDVTVPSLSDTSAYSISLDGCNMNDLVIMVGPSDPHDEYSCHIEARIALRFLCPIDKAPNGMAVGDRWPKVWPLQVELEEAYEEFYDSMLEWSQTPTPEDIDDMMGDLSMFGEDSLGMLEFDEAQTSFVSSAFILAQPLVSGLFPLIFFGIIALIFANKAMH